MSGRPDSGTPLTSVETSVATACGGSTSTASAQRGKTFNGVLRLDVSLTYAF